VCAAFETREGKHAHAQDGLHGDEQGGRIKRLEEDLGCFLAVLAWIQWRLSQQYRVFCQTNKRTRGGVSLWLVLSGANCIQ
jgi:hypothetical protein